MTSPNDEAAAERPLQFEAAEPTGASQPLACTSCSAAIRGVYHEANGAVVCSACRRALEGHLRGGTSAGRFLKALLLGGVAAAVGAAVYFGIALAFQIELGLIAIVVGWMVGRAVNAGSRGRGGWRYQTLAIALTYSAIVVTYMPAAIERSMGASLVADTTAAAPLAEAIGESDEGSEPVLLAVATPADSAARAAAADVPAGVAIAVGLTFVFILAWVEPLRQGLPNLMGLVIIAIGLYQAWLQNRPTPVSITGPYSLGDARSSATP